MQRHIKLLILLNFIFIPIGLYLFFINYPFQRSVDFWIICLVLALPWSVVMPIPWNMVVYGIVTLIWAGVLRVLSILL
ncbi:MAG: hypothetical protein NWF08_04670 [Candidatus Bathyarchaeota archaeon]|nr:hypothetical protein [Candidatus Bathyarchaeota archaeon]